MIHLIAHYCTHSLPARQAEYDFCFERNLSNPSIAAVHNLVDPSTRVPEAFCGHPKYIERNLPGQYLSFTDAMAYANRTLPGQIVCIANLDVFLADAPQAWQQAESIARSNIVLALSRTEFMTGGFTYRDPALASIGWASTQDAWIFLAPFEAPDCGFDIGTLGCDNAFADRIKRAGRIPLNAGGRFPIFHVDQARGKNNATQKQVHARERAGLKNDFPEERGQYLLPDIDSIASVDELMTQLKATPLQRYLVLCDALNRLMSVSNR